MNESIRNKYEAVIGLEVHAQLLSKSKMYSSDSAEYGGMPNTHVSEVSLGHPGTLPVVNTKAIEFAIKMGLACNCTIRKENRFARKNYFYADLPKGYQITQFDTPICYDGKLEIKVGDQSKSIGITRIHLEEDAGKSMHDQDINDSLVDLNRAGVPLIEIVSEPDLRSADDAYAYLTEIRKIVRYLEVCDGNMEEGSLRCDANISVRPVGQKEFGNRCEVKNMNSIRNVKRAIEHEINRQIMEVEAGNAISQDTLSFNATTGTTFVLRSKEMANDYRYFPEPDLPPVILTDSYIQEVQAMMPPLPEALARKYTQELGLSEYDANLLTDNKEIALFFEDLITHTKNIKSAANWVMGPIKSYLNENALHINEAKIKVKDVAALIAMIDEGKVSNSIAEQKIFPALVKEGKAPAQLAAEMNVLIEDNQEEVSQMIDQALAQFPEKVLEYKSGKKGLIGLFMGEVMKISKGKVNPKEVNKLLTEKLES